MKLKSDDRLPIILGIAVTIVFFLIQKTRDTEVVLLTLLFALLAYPIHGAAKTVGRRIGGLIILALVVIALGWITWPRDEKFAGPAFAIQEDAAIISPEFNKAMLFVSFDPLKKIAPIHVLAAYTITVLKPTPVMISHISLEMKGSHEIWWPLSNLPTELPIWAADVGQTSRGVTRLIPGQGMLIANVRNVELKTGQVVQGIILCQLPADFTPPKESSNNPIRLRIADTAGDEVFQPPNPPSASANVTSSMFQLRALPDIDIHSYEIVPYP
ncbi:MAG TPA: hypothetical protein VJQ59_08475 [Candidatus Sulfotelmatobacter sp.]|nr:hypothetical protein [Candidatus Sulfotelmatobacter sp.]